MKRYFILIVLVIIAFGISGCSSEPNLELISTNVSIVKDKSITGSTLVTEGDKKGMQIVATALVYEFTIKNNGKKIRKKNILDKLNSKYDPEINEINVEPNGNLKNASQEILGRNIFDLSSYMNSGLGYSRHVLAIKAGEEKKFTLYYELGISEESYVSPIITPPQDKLMELEKYALDANLVIRLDNEETARFHLDTQ
jgi:hypothetical protein